MSSAPPTHHSHTLSRSPCASPIPAQSASAFLGTQISLKAVGPRSLCQALKLGWCSLSGSGPLVPPLSRLRARSPRLRPRGLVAPGPAGGHGVAFVLTRKLFPAPASCVRSLPGCPARPHFHPRILTWLPLSPQTVPGVQISRLGLFAACLGFLQTKTPARIPGVRVSGFGDQGIYRRAQRVGETRSF